VKALFELMPSQPQTGRMFPIALINTRHAMRHALLGSDARDPVVPYRVKRRRLRRRDTS
jgi:hypothetical protein